MPCFVLRSMSLHAYMFRSTCLGFYAMFPLFRSFLCFALMLGLYAYVLDTMSMAMLCSNLCACMLFAMFYAQICICTCLYAWIHVLPCLCASFHMFTRALLCLCLDLHFYMLVCSDLGFHMLICPDLYFHMLVCLDLCSACFMPSSMCLCAPYYVCVLRPRLCLSCYVLLQPFCHFTFLSCVLATWLGPDLDPMVFVIVHIPWPISKDLDHPFACPCLLASMLYLQCWPLQFQTLLCLTPLTGCGCVVTSNAHEAFSRCNHLGGISMMLVASCIPLPFLLHVMICLPCLFAPPVSFLCIFTHLLTCSSMSLAYQCVIHASTQ